MGKRMSRNIIKEEADRIKGIRAIIRDLEVGSTDKALLYFRNLLPKKKKKSWPYLKC